MEGIENLLRAKMSSPNALVRKNQILYQRNDKMGLLAETEKSTMT